MSRLLEMLSRVDRRGARPEGVGGIPDLAAGPSKRANWRLAVALVIVATMSLIPVAVMLRPRSVARTPVPAGPVLAPIPPPAMTPPTRAEDGSGALLDQGLVAFQRGSLGEAADLFRKVIEMARGNAEAWNSLGVVLVLQRDVGQGVAAFRQALRADPAHAEAHRNLAVALDRQGKLREALDHYRAFLHLAPERHPAREDVRLRLAEVAPTGSEP